MTVFLNTREMHPFCEMDPFSKMDPFGKLDSFADSGTNACAATAIRAFWMPTRALPDQGGFSSRSCRTRWQLVETLTVVPHDP